MKEATNFFLNMDSWFSGLAFLVLLFIGWGAGIWASHKHGAPTGGHSVHVEDAGLALFGLVIAFWFSGAAARYQQRKVLLRNDAIAIGEFSTVSTALNGPLRSEIRSELVAYVHQRLTFGQMSMADPELPHVVAEGRTLQGQIWTSVDQAVATKNNPSVNVPLINAYNGLVAAGDGRLYGTLDHVPQTIIVMLLVLGIFTTFNMGRLRDQDERITSSLLRVGAYIVLVTLVFTVTLDLEQPRGGIMRVSPAPMEDLLQALSTPLPPEPSQLMLPATDHPNGQGARP